MFNKDNKFALSNNKHYQKLIQLIIDSNHYFMIRGSNTKHSSEMFVSDDLSVMVELSDLLIGAPSIEHDSPFVKTYNHLFTTAKEFDRFSNHGSAYMRNYERVIALLAYHNKTFFELDSKYLIVQQLFKVLKKKDLNYTSLSFTSYGEYEYLMIDSTELPLMFIQLENLFVIKK